jgi:apolipoprotein N-acyltransferase
VHHTWHKHHPAPGEPMFVGDEKPTTVTTAYGRITGAICYDYDYPALARAHGRLGADLVALPSSDWSGIDPLHTQMAALRAIEEGFSIVRSTRFGLSAAIDPHGRLRAWRSSFDGASSRLLVAELPRRGVPTLYRSTGDVLVLAAAAWLLVLAFRTIRQRSRSPLTRRARAGHID